MNSISLDSPSSLPGDALMHDIKPVLAPSVQASVSASSTARKSATSSSKKLSFECTSCTRKFSTRSHLVRHSHVHTGQRRFACDYPGCEMRCSRKDNLQQHYRTHLVVNPRRANAQATLALANDLVATTTPSVASQQQQHQPSLVDVSVSVSPIQPTVPSQAVHYAAKVHSPIPRWQHPVSQPQSQVHTPQPYQNQEYQVESRAQSMSPPPLGNAYDYWYTHGCLPPASIASGSGDGASGSGSSGATSPELQPNALELVPGQRHQQGPGYFAPNGYDATASGHMTPSSQFHPDGNMSRRGTGTGPIDISPPPSRHGLLYHPPSSAYPAAPNTYYQQTESPVATLPHQSAARYSQEYSQSQVHPGYPQSNDRHPSAPAQGSVYMPYPTEQHQPRSAEEFEAYDRQQAYAQAAHPAIQHYAQAPAPNASYAQQQPNNAQYPYSSSRYQQQPAPSSQYYSAQVGYVSQEASPVLRQDAYYPPQSRPVTAHGHEDAQQSLVLPPIRGGSYPVPAPLGGGWDRMAVSDARAR